VELSKKNLIIVGGIILALILGIVLLGKKPTLKPTVTNQDSNNRDFNVIEKKEEVVVFNTPTPIPTLIPTSTPRLTPTLTPTLIPTSTPTLTPIPTTTPTTRLIPTRKPTRQPTATPTPDNAIKATGVSLSTTQLNLGINQSHQVLSRVEPNETTDKTVTWSSSNGNIATVDTNGNVTAKALGDTIITAKTSNGKTTIVRVIVSNNPDPTSTPTPTVTSVPVVKISIYPEKIKLNYTSVNLKVNDKEQLRLDIKPENVTDFLTRWSSSNSNIAIVNIRGMVTAKSPGTTIITAKTVNGLVDSTTVTVVKR